VPAVFLPYDRHLAVGGAIEPWRLGDGSRTAAVQLAAIALERALVPRAR
jgi:hypothetical protein